MWPCKTLGSLDFAAHGFLSVWIMVAPNSAVVPAAGALAMLDGVPAGLRGLWQQSGANLNPKADVSWVGIYIPYQGYLWGRGKCYLPFQNGKNQQQKSLCSSQAQPAFFPMAFVGRRPDLSRPYRDKCLLALPSVSRLFALVGPCQSIQSPNSS